MELDVRTLIVGSVLNAALFGVLALHIAGGDRKLRAIRHWGIAMLVLGAGLGSLALRGIAPLVVTISLANTLIVVAIALALRSLRMFGRNSMPDYLPWVIVLTLFAISFIFARPEVDYRLRIVTISLGMAMLFARGAVILRRDVPPECRQSYRFTEFVFWLCAAMTGSRSIIVMFERSLDVMEPTVLHAGIFLFYGAFITVTSIGVLWMANQGLQAELAHSAHYDPLTDVLNRGAFLHQFEREVSRSERDRTPFSLAIFDLDRFKRINDAYGHPIGDVALKSVVHTMRASIRKHDVIGRYGGEEFALLMPNTAKETAMRVAERIRREVELRALEAAGRRVALTVSGGVATFQIDGEDWDSLLTAADTALYDAKAMGRNRVVAARAPESLASNG